MEVHYQIFIEREFLISTTRDFPKDKFPAQRELVLVKSIKLFKTMWTTTRPFLRRENSRLVMLLHKMLLITLNPRNCASPAHTHLNFNSGYCWMERMRSEGLFYDEEKN